MQSSLQLYQLYTVTVPINDEENKALQAGLLGVDRKGDV